MTIGERANGRLITASITALPFHLWRTRRIAQTTPKMVLRGTAMATIRRLSFRACRPFSEVAASIGKDIKSLNVSEKMITRGAASSRARKPRPRMRRLQRLTAPEPTWLRALAELIVSTFLVVGHLAGHRHHQAAAGGAFVAAAPALDKRNCCEAEERGEEEHHGDRRRAGQVARLDLGPDEDR